MHPSSLSSLFHPMFLLASAASKFPSFRKRKQFWRRPFFGNYFAPANKLLLRGPRHPTSHPGHGGRGSGHPRSTCLLVTGDQMCMWWARSGQSGTFPRQVRSSFPHLSENQGHVSPALTMFPIWWLRGEHCVRGKKGSCAEGSQERGEGAADGIPGSVPSSSWCPHLPATPVTGEENLCCFLQC